MTVAQLREYINQPSLNEQANVIFVTNGIEGESSLGLIMSNCNSVCNADKIIGQYTQSWWDYIDSLDKTNTLNNIEDVLSSTKNDLKEQFKYLSSDSVVISDIKF